MNVSDKATLILCNSSSALFCNFHLRRHARFLSLRRGWPLPIGRARRVERSVIQYLLKRSKTLKLSRFLG